MKTNERINSKTGQKDIRLNFWCPEKILKNKTYQDLLINSYNGNFTYFMLDIIKGKIQEDLQSDIEFTE